MKTRLDDLARKLEGALYFNESPLHQTQLLAYSTDASVYQEKPLAVALPQNARDLQLLVQFARDHSITLIPRAAGTSLAGQVVGSGIVVDISRHFNQVLEVNEAERWVRVQPGVIRDDLNAFLRPYGLMFGPETSTANRAMIGGMIGNNSCGLHSIVWGAVCDHLLEVKVVLSDGSEAVFGEEALDSPMHSGLKKEILDGLNAMLSLPAHQQLIREHFPKPSVVRRNTGYGLDRLLNRQPFSPSGQPFNLCQLIAGSEGTLVFVSEAKLQLLPLPPKEMALVCVHCHSLDEALRANIVALKHRPMASELVDRYIMNFTYQHPEYRKNCFFVEGDPAAILMVEFMADARAKVDGMAQQFIEALKGNGYGYAYPVLFNNDTRYAWDVRKAGLGLLRNSKGDTQPVNLIEDCAVAPEELPDYVQDIQALLDRHGVPASYYAHAGAGELHIEPMVNLKSGEGVRLFRTLLAETVAIVKKYKGSLSGEHGDGRLRGEYIPSVMGAETYRLFQQVKQLFDPQAVFNKGKITGTPPMDTFLRMEGAGRNESVATHFDFSRAGGMLRLAEKCSGSGDCRKTQVSGGVMCPSYMATRNEKDTTRARANVLRQFLSREGDLHPLDHQEIGEVMDLCLSCKGCKTECPSGVDVAKLKAEFLQHYYDRNGVPFRSRLIGNFTGQMKLASAVPWAYNFIYQNNLLRKVVNRLVGFHPDRTMPLLPASTLQAWFRKRAEKKAERQVFLFCDEFTNYYDAEIGKKTILLLEALGYQVILPPHRESGRTWLSKGLVKKAGEIANANIEALAPVVSESIPVIGIEPSAILTLRDEYPDLARPELKEQALHLAKHTLTVEEFICREWERGRITREVFTDEKLRIALHGHCYQKALSSQHFISNMLSLPRNYSVQVIPSGCCGMAGAFGYEKEHFAVSQQVGELVLFPTVRNLSAETIIAASGTSCRHQILDGTGRKAWHPVEILFHALKINRK